MISRQAITDFLWGAAFSLAITAAVGFLGLLSYWFQWDDNHEDFIDYRIEHQRPEPKFVRV